LIEAFEAVEVVTVELTADTTEQDLDGLLRLLRGERPLAERIGGIVLNRIRPTLLVDEVTDVDLSGVRRAYARGLEVMRDNGQRVASGTTVDLEAATGVVERLADEVAAEPASALLLTTIKSYDEHTHYHLLNVGLLSIALGRALGLRRDQVISLGLGGLLHDIGKVHMPTDVLFHVGRLSEEQWRIVQRHPVDGAGLVFGTEEGLFHPAATVVLEHHAAYDLSGYPPLRHRAHPSVPARLVAVADCFDAVTSRRSYRAPSPRREALDILEAGAGRGFDPRVVRVFVSLMGLLPIGSLVQLTTGEIAVVVRNGVQRPARPTVVVMLDAAGNVADPEERDLASVGPDGTYRWEVARPVDPDELGVDVMAFLDTGEVAAPAGGEPTTGLVHEPSHGERRPDGYVDTHAEVPAGLHRHHEHGLPAGARVDPDVHPPLDDDHLG
jgi:HD-GYP domain-containing protein (c-di-GMP phosphodiesterase class II)